MSDNDKLGPPPVDPMSDVAWARVERGLWSRIDSGATDQLPSAPPRRWLWVAVPMLAVAAVVALLLATGLFGTRGDAPTVSVIDAVEPSRVVAGAAPSAVSFGDAHIDLAAQSAIVMTREGESPSVLLERGTATFAVAPRVDRAPFVVRAGDTVVRVVGTRFIVSRSEELITVTVEHGLVDVQFRGESHRIGASQTWSSGAPDKIALHTPNTHAATPDTHAATPNTHAATPNTNAATPDTHAANAATPGTHAATPDAHAATPNTNTNVRIPDTNVRIPDTNVRIPDKRTGSGTGRTSGTSDTRTGSGTAHTSAVPGAGARAPHTATPATVAGAPAGAGVTPGTKDADAAKYDRLVALEQKDPTAALSGYLELSRGNSKWASVALYAAGRLASDRQDRRAATLLDNYLRRFPNGANADDARNLLARLKGDIP